MAWAKYAGASGSPVTTASQKDTKTIPVMPSELLEGARPAAISQRLPPWWVSSGSLVVNIFASMAEVEGLGQGTDTLLSLWTCHTYASCQGPVLAGTCRHSFASVRWCSSLCSQQVYRVSLLAPLAFKKNGWELGRCSANKVTCCANRNT